MSTVSCFIIKPAADKLDSKHFEILPVGEVGELAIGGTQLATGYLNNAEKTATAFIDSPYGIVYRTGDKARLHQDGTLECMGRIADGQIKLRGQRIELGEIEHAILKRKGCHGVSVRVIGAILVAFCAVESFITEDDITGTCAEWLPQFMVPGEVILMEELPRLPSGKVDAKILQTEFEQSKHQFKAGEDIIENADENLLQVLQGFFGSDLGSRTDLVRRGLDSLTAISLSSNLRRAGYDIKATSLLKMKTIGNILCTAIKIETADGDAVDDASISYTGKLQELQTHELESELAHRQVQDIIPCTSLQIAMLSETLRNGSAYWNTVQLEVCTAATPSDILLAIHTLISHNENLRSGFLQHESTFHCIIFDRLHPNCVTISNEPAQATATSSSLLQPFKIHIQQTAKSGVYHIQLHLHHSMYDGWTLDLLKSDLAKAISKERLPERAQFRDVVSFLQSRTREQYDERAKVFWADYLFGWSKSPFPRLTSKVAKSSQIQTRQLLCKLPTGGNQTYTGSKQVPFQAAISLVWAGIVGLQDVVIGSVTSGRTIPVNNIESIMGPCIASLPLRVNMESMTTIDDLVNSISSSNRRMMDHTTLSQLGIKKLANLYGGDQLYDVLFVYQESPEHRNLTGCFVQELSHVDRLETRLVLEVYPGQDEVILQATFHDADFPSDLVEIILRQVSQISFKICENYHALLSSVTCFDQDISTYNLNLENTKRTPGLDDLASIVEQTVALYPDRLAVSFATEISPAIFSPNSISFFELNRNSNRIAHFLLSQGVKPGDIIPIIMDKSIRLYTTILGILKAGCGYLPLLPTTPRARIAEIFNQAGSSLCLADEGSLRAIPPMSTVRFILIDEESMEDFSGMNPSVRADPSSPAYVIYTSGTTGTPKGVTVSQKNIASNVTYLGATYPEAKDKPLKFLQACSQAFDVSVFEIFYAWHRGMCLCAAANDVLFADLEEAIRKFEITHLSLTPTIASLIDPVNVPTVDFLVTAGEPMTNAVHARWNQFLWQGYGPSETTNICSVKKMSSDDYVEHLGLVFDNTSVFVLQPMSFSTLPIGWAGEFCFGGDQVASGYLNMPRLTAEKFFEHPTYGRIYRSGDFGRMLPDGSLVILGRIDDQIKLRGQRIEAAEINGIVSQVTAATAAVTLVLKHKDSIGEWLVTFYAGSDTAKDLHVLDPVAELQGAVFAELNLRLLPYMVPSYLIPVSHIPLTSSGKVDKRAIKTMFSQLSKEYLQTVVHGATRDDEKDWNEAERSVALLMADSLGVPRAEIGRWTPLAILGLDSISAIQVSRSMSIAFTITVPISAVLKQPTVAQLAKMLGHRQTNQKTVSSRQYFDQQFLESITDIFAKESKVVCEVLPCSPLQEAMASRGKKSYYNKSLLRLRVDPYEMRSYWQHMCDRHSILRTCFVSTSSKNYPIAQFVLARWELPWHEFTVTQPSLDDAIREHLSLVPEPLDSNTPPLSLALIRYRESSFLSFICHHTLYDGVAMECLWREVEALAHGEQLRPAISYGSFIHPTMNLPEDNEKFWKQQLTDFQPALLFPHFDQKSFEQVTHTITIDRSLRTAQHRMKSLGISLLSVCQAAITRVLAQVSLKNDVCFGNVMNGRTIGVDGIERLVAPCFNTVPIRQNLSTPVSNIDLAKILLELNTELLEHQFTPLRQVQKIAATDTRSLFDVLLLVQQPLQEMDDTIWTLEEDSGTMDLPLVCEVTPCPSLDSLILDVHYDMTSVPVDLAAGIAELFKYTFRQILESPHTIMGQETIPDSLRDGIRHHQLSFVNDEIDEYDSENSDFSWTEEELDVRNILSELSEVSTGNIERTTSLFKLGLDSINAVQVASLLRRRHYLVSASDIVECQSCLKIARRIYENGYQPKKAPEQYDFAAFDLEARQLLERSPLMFEVLPCTPMQCAMLSSFLSSEGINYLNEISLEMQDGISAMKVADKWAELTKAHSMLRTGFAPIRHTDCTYAMLQYENISQEQVMHTSKSFDHTSWMLDVSKAIQTDLRRPPWRLAIVTRSDRVTVHLAIHHAIYDATSLQQMLTYFGKLLNGHTVQPVEDVHIGLSQIVQRSKGEMEAASSFWKQMGEEATVNKFPVLTPLREVDRYILTEECSSVLAVSDLNQMTKALGISVQTAILASWTRILACYTGEEAVVFGVTLSGRTCESTINTPIPCLTTVPVVAQNTASNRKLLDQLMKWVSDMHQHQFLPLSRIQKELGYPAAAVFDTLVAYQKIEQDIEERPWIQKQDGAAVEFPVSLEVEPSLDGALHLRLTYFSDVLPSEQARLLLKQFDATIESLLRYPDGQQSDLYSLNSEIFAVSPPLEPIMNAPVQLLHQFVEMQARLNPDRLALEHVSGFHENEPIRKRWTFAELDSMGNRVANMLSSRTTAGSIIAVHFDKYPEAYFAILGILKSGSAFVALDFNAPKARKEFILQDSSAPVLLTGRGDVIDFDVPCPVLVVDEGLLNEYSESPCAVNGEVSPSSTCYCLYTSGTTGTPKGCEITHENTVQCMMAFQDLFKGHWADDSRWLQFAALHFDVSVLEQYWSWSVGMAIVAAKKDLILDDLIGFINNVNITHIDLTPSLARLTHPDTVPSLCRGVFITGGEQLKQEILDAWGSKAVIYNAYGPTEATIGVTTYQRVPQNGRPSNIGRQFRNVGSYVFQKDTEIPVFRGAVGELCVSGKLVGKGYLNRPDLTMEKFPTLKIFGERIYRTGDLVRILHDGCFEFLGRADDQVKLRGQRLELGEIDHVIRSVSTIHDVTTLVTKHTLSGKDVLVSFIVHEKMNGAPLCVLEDSNGISSEARDVCRDKLPGYMIPSYFLLLPYIPLSPNNKAEAKQLRKIFAELSQEDLVNLSSSAMKRLVDTEGANYQTLINLISKFCNLDQDILTPSASIFDFGVDSITVLQLCLFLVDGGFAAASPALVLRNPIVADLAFALSNTSLRDTVTELRQAKLAVQACEHKYRSLVCKELSLSPSEIEYIYPCSPLQQGMLAKTAVEDGQGSYFNAFRLLLKPNASLIRFKSALKSLVATEPILRTCFIHSPTGYIQVALRALELPYKEYCLAKNETLDEVLDSMRQEWIVTNTPQLLVPLEVVGVADENNYTWIIFHIFHGLYDGTSFGLLMKKLVSLYKGSEAQPGNSFSAALLHGPLRNHDDAKEKWKEHLQGWSSANLSLAAAENSSVPISTTKVLEISKIEHLRSRNNVTVQSVLLAAWSSVLQNHSANAVTTGVIVSGRSINIPGVDLTIGPLFNTLPFFANLSAGQSWEILLKRCQHFNAMVLEDPHVPLQQLQKWTSNGKSLFENLFVYQVEDKEMAASDMPWHIQDGGLNPDYPLALEVTKRCDGSMQLLLVVQSDVTNEAKLNQLLAEFEDMLESMGKNGTIPVQVPSAPPHIFEEEEAKTVTDTSPFVWTANANIMRKELQVLSNVPEADITPSTTWLELGLDSIDAVQLSARLKRQHLAISPSTIMKGGSFKSIVNALNSFTTSIEGKEASGVQDIKKNLLRNHVEAAGVDISTIEGVFPTTPLQDSMVAGMIESDFTWYFNHEILEVAPGVDVSKLQTAWLKVFEASPILRTGFVEISDPTSEIIYAQVVYKNLPAVETVVLGSMDDLKGVVKKSTSHAISNAARTGLVSLVRARLGDRTFYVLSISHALYDGWSLGLLHEDLMAAYEGEIKSRPSSESFLFRSSNSLTSEATDFWTNYLDGVLSTTICDASLPNLPQVARAEKMSAAKLEEINAFCRTQKISLQSLCQGCWAIVLARRTRSLDVVFGAVLSGRDFEDAENLMFPTMNTVPVRCILHGSIRSFLQYMEDNMSELRSYQMFPLRKAKAVANLAGKVFFDSLFLLQKSHSTATSTSQTLFKSVQGSASVDYPVCVEAAVVDGFLEWTVACQSQSGLADELIDELDSTIRYVLHNADDAIVAFTRAGVQIAGCQPIEFAQNENTDTISVKEVLPIAWDSTSSAIRQILSQVSNVPEESIEASNNLYHLGLDSITAIKVSTLLKQQGIHLRPTDLVRAANLMHMAELAKSMKDGFETPYGGNRSWESWTVPEKIGIDEILQQVGISQGHVEHILPALPMQVYMLSTWQNTNGKVFYPEFTYTLSGSISVVDVYKAWAQVVEQLPMLRTCLVATGQEELPFIQVITRPDVALSGQQPFVNFTVRQRLDDPSVLLLRLRIHHALYDGVSLPATIDALLAALRGFVPEPPISMHQWVHNAIFTHTNVTRNSRKAFWTKYLDGYISTPREDVFTGPRTSLFKPGASANATELSATAARYGISTQALIFAAYAMCIARNETVDKKDRDHYDRSSSSSVVFGIYMANRTDERSPETLPTLNLVPLRVFLPSGSDDADILHMALQIHKDVQTLSTTDGEEGNANVGLWEIAQWTGVKVDKFVNFLTLPTVSEGQQLHQQQSDIQLTATPAAAAERSQDVAATQEDVAAERSLDCVLIANNVVRNTYPVS